LRAVTNPLKHKYLLVWAALLVACGGKKADQRAMPAPTVPLPTAGLAGQKVPLLPLTLIAAEDSLHWEVEFADRRGALGRCDSIIGSLLAARAPEVTWVGAGELRRVARRAAGIAADPDQMGTAFLRATDLVDVPDPLRYQLRTLVGLAGGRYALVPAGLVFRRTAGLPDPKGLPDGRGQTGGTGVSPARPPARPPVATAELSIVLVDARIGRVGWRTVARGEGDDPWTALTRAVKSLTPGLP
jgi:hypothetical protein